MDQNSSSSTLMGSEAENFVGKSIERGVISSSSSCSSSDSDGGFVSGPEDFEKPVNDYDDVISPLPVYVKMPVAVPTHDDDHDDDFEEVSGEKRGKNEVESEIVEKNGVESEKSEMEGKKVEKNGVESENNGLEGEKSEKNGVESEKSEKNGVESEISEKNGVENEISEKNGVESEKSEKNGMESGKSGVLGGEEKGVVEPVLSEKLNFVDEPVWKVGTVCSENLSIGVEDVEYKSSDEKGVVVEPVLSEKMSLDDEAADSEPVEVVHSAKDENMKTGVVGEPDVEVVEPEVADVTKRDIVDVVEVKETELVNGSSEASPNVEKADDLEDVDVMEDMVHGSKETSPIAESKHVDVVELANGSSEANLVSEKANIPEEVEKVEELASGSHNPVEAEKVEDLVSGSSNPEEVEKVFEELVSISKLVEAEEQEANIVDVVEDKKTELANVSEESPIVKEANNPDNVENFGELVNGSNETSPVVEKASIPKDVENIDVSTKQSAKEEEELKADFDDAKEIEATEVTAGEEFEDADDGEANMEELDSDEETDGMIFGSSQAAKQFIEELEREGGSGTRFIAPEMDGQIVTDSEEEVETDGEGDEKEVFDSAAFAALLKAATGGGGDSDGGNITITSQDGSRLFSIERPAGLGSSVRSVQPTGRTNRSSLFAPPSVEADKELSEEEKKKLETLQKLRVKFLRLVRRLGASPEDSVAAQVLYRLTIIAGRPNNRAFSLDEAKATALELETEGKDDLEFSINILVLGKSGVGKSSTINSIFGEEKAKVGAFEPGTIGVREITGVVDGVKVKVIDTPGLKSAVMEQAFNRKILSSVKGFTKKSPSDIVLYVDRLDTQTRDLNDLPMLKTITAALGQAIWRSAIVALTHGASAPPDGPNGNPLNYEVSVTQRSHVVQQSIGHAVGDLRMMSPSLMNPVSLVENHPLCRKNRDGQQVLPNGQTWRPQLLLLCYSMKILAEANLISKPQDPFDHRKLFGFRVRAPPLPYLLSSMLQTQAHPKLPSDQGIDNGDSDVDMADFSDSDNEGEEDEYDQLPPFKPLKKAQIDKLSKEQRKAYFEEFDYRVKLLQKKQWKEEIKRVKEMKKKEKNGVSEYGFMGDEQEQEAEGAAPVATPLPDMVLPPSFDSDNPAYRYRFLEPTSQFLARPVLDTHGWDHDCGYDGVNLEQSLTVASRFPAAVSVQVTKDKKDFSIHLNSSIAAKHGEDGSTMAGFDIQNVGKQLAYIVRGETKLKKWKKNKTAAGMSVTFLGENVATGLKVEDQITFGKQWAMVGSAGTVRCQGDAAYGANFELQRRELDYPIGQVQSTYGLSLIKWRGDWALGFNSVAQFAIGRNSKVALRAGINNKLSGQITARTSSSDHLSLVLVGIIPIASAIYKKIWPAAADNYSIY